MLKIQNLLPLLLVFILSCSSISSRTGPDNRDLASSEPEQMIVDSDGAVFWDDGAALAMLLQHPKKVRILGITLSLGNHWPYQGAEYLARILKAAGRSDIPLYVGADHPLKNSKDQLGRLELELIRQGLIEKTGFWKGAYSRSKEVKSVSDIEPAKGEELTGILPQEKSAVQFIIDTINAALEPITFVALGPLTNLAMALQKDPRIATKIRRLLIMGGAIHAKGNTTPYAELNFLFDPEAAQRVLSSQIQQKVLFPLDLSNLAVITQERYQDLVSVSAPYVELLKADRGPKFKDRSYMVPSWDTTVAAYLIDPDYITESEDLSLKINVEFGQRYGAVELAPQGENSVKVMTKMNSEKFFSILKAALTSPPVKED